MSFQTGHLPAPLRGREKGTFTHHTVTGRMPEIARRILVENELPASVSAAVMALIDDLPNGRVRFLNDADAPDVDEWNRWIEPYLGSTWLDVPWFFAETYFYRRIAEATGFMRTDTERLDPFLMQKRLGLQVARAETEALAQQLERHLGTGFRAEDLAALLLIDLWGNQADLSMWPAETGERPRHDDALQAAAALLVDDAPHAAALVARRPTGRVDIVVDNAGFELVGDLALADYLLTTGRSSKVRLHLKQHPTFVSDALVADVLEAVGVFEREQGTATARLGARLRAHLDAGALMLSDDSYWTSPLEGAFAAETLARLFDSATLVVSKGDANYRRFVGDRHWPFDTAFSDAVSYLTRPYVALRTLKSEVLVGIPIAVANACAAEDAGWLVDGRRGVVQLYEPLVPSGLTE